jgi:hypothetical protein
MSSPAGGGTAVGEAPAIEGLVAPKARPSSSSSSSSSSSLSNEQLARAAEIENAKRRELAVLMAQLDSQQSAPGASAAAQNAQARVMCEAKIATISNYHADLIAKQTKIINDQNMLGRVLR